MRDAIIREVKEETGLEFEPRFLGCFDEIIPDREIHAVVVVYTGVGAGRMLAQEAEVAEMAWYSIAESRSLPLAFKHNAILDAYAASKALA